MSVQSVLGMFSHVPTGLPGRKMQFHVGIVSAKYGHSVEEVRRAL